VRALIRLLITAGLLTLAGAVNAPANAQDITRGEHEFKKCEACHAKDASNRLGPGLLGIVGRQSGSAPGFRYSRAIKSANIKWDATSLDAFITAPQKFLPGTTMPFSGIPNEGERADLIAYLGQLK
jgi:cytochrome c